MVPKMPFSAHLSKPDPLQNCVLPFTVLCLKIFLRYSTNRHLKLFIILSFAVVV